MKTRIITALLGLVLVIPCLVFSNTIALDILFSLITAAAVIELIRCAGQGKNYALLVPTTLLALFTPFTVRWINVGVDFITFLTIAFVFYIFYVFYYM